MQEISGIKDSKGPLSQSESGCNCFPQKRKAIGGFRKVEDQNINVMLFKALETFEFRYLFPLVIYEETLIPLSLSPGRDIGVESFPATDDRSKNVDRASFQTRANRLDDGVLGLRNNGLSGNGTVLGPQLCVE